jgi:hypothetical protein
MRSSVLAGLTLLSILLILSFGGVAITEKGSMTKNMTAPMNMTTPMNLTTPMNMTMPMSMKMPMNMTMPMNMKMPNKTANGSMSMVMLQNVTLNIILIQNLTEITNNIIPANINATNGNKTKSLNAVKPSAMVM